MTPEIPYRESGFWWLRAKVN